MYKRNLNRTMFSKMSIITRMTETSSPFVMFFLVLCLTTIVPVHSISWDRSVDLNNDFRLLWTINKQEITFEVQVRTLGYVGLGFSRDGQLGGSDVAVGWVDQGQAYFQKVEEKEKIAKSSEINSNMHASSHEKRF
ncbi:unnamed protein product [Hermetia illucens]|uniref:DOMON domain-containing protein n=1 Tax=Hermetia illucens TaxID=343691 RepID=A0A7R8UIM0_HERIL|nr:unnamed protein product [Hermetia illucens]